MKKTLMNVRLLPLASVLMAWGVLASCEHKDLLVADTSANGQLVININSGALGTRATDLQTDQGANEKKIQNVAIGIFRNADATPDAGKLVEFIYQANGSQTTTHTEHKVIERESGSTKLSVEAGDVVLAVVNVTDGLKTALEAATTADAFRKVTATLDQALAQTDDFVDGTTTYSANGRAIAPTHLPMYGEATVTGSDAAGYRADVDVLHMVAKVTIQSIKLQSTGNTFQLEEVFMRNVPGKLDFLFSDAPATLNTYSFNAHSATPLYHGESGETTYREYLTSGSLTTTALNSGDAHDTPHILYTMPNQETKGEGKNTKIVLRGKWNDEETYYAIDLGNVNASGNGIEDYKVRPNYHYIIDVVIKRKGADNSTDALPENQPVELTIQSVSDWDGQSQTTTFNPNGGTPTES